jgi:putative endonuclease
LHKLVYFEEFQYIDDAIKREKQLKNWHRQWKINLIEEGNPNWNDLSELKK